MILELQRVWNEIDFRALMDRGRQCAFEGRYDEAEGALREALDLARGTGTPAESAACGNLGSLYGVMGRRFEATLLYRQGLALARACGRVDHQARHLANLAAMFAVLDVWSEVEETLHQLELAVLGLPEDERPAARDLALWPRAQLALQRGELRRARAFLERFLEDTNGREDELARLSSVTLEADLLRREDRPEAALALLEGYACGAGASACDELYLRSQRIGALLELEREDDALEAAERALEAVETGVRHDGVGELGIELVSDLGRCLARSTALLHLAHRAFDLAAAITLDRIAALDRCAEKIPELSVLQAEDRLWIQKLRGAYRQQQGQLLHHVAEMLRRQGEVASFLYAAGSDRNLLRICAWCSRIGTRDGHWLPLAHYIPDDDRIHVTHCICHACARTEGLE